MASFLARLVPLVRSPRQQTNMAEKLVICGLKIPRPLQKHLVVSLLTSTIFLIAFLLFLLVGLSLPIMPSIYIIQVTAVNSTNPVSDASTTLYFGVWGVCATGPLLTAGKLCYGPQLGYSIPLSLLNGASLSTELANVAETSLLLLLSLHLVVAGLSTIIFVLSLFLHSHAVAIISLIIAIVAALVGAVVFAADVALVIVVQNNINSLFPGASFGVLFGNAVWMILVAMVMTWVAVVVLSARACYCCGVRRPTVQTSVKVTSEVAAEK